MNFLRYILVASAGLIFALGLVIYFAGVTLTVKNSSKSPIANVKVEYSRGSVTFPSIPAGESRKTFLGKIGEGSNFVIKWTDNSNNERGAKFYAYFSSFDPFLDVRIALREDDRVLLYEEQNVNEPSDTW